MIDGEEEDPIEIELNDDDDLDAEQKQDGEVTAETGENDDELVVEIEGLDEPPVEETPLIRDLRAKLRDEKRRRLEAESRQQPVAEIEVGPKPDLWEDSDGDQEAHDTKLLSWQKRKDDAERQKNERGAVEQARAENFQRAYQTMRTNAAKLPGRFDFDKAEDQVKADLHPALAELIPLEFGERAPATVIALSQRPELLERINTTAKTNFIQAMFELYDLSKGIKMVPKRKTGAKAEEIVRGSAPLSVVPADKKQAELEKAVDQGKPGAQEALMAFLAAKRKQARAA